MLLPLLTRSPLNLNTIAVLRDCIEKLAIKSFKSPFEALEVLTNVVPIDYKSKNPFLNEQKRVPASRGYRSIMQNLSYFNTDREEINGAFVNMMNHVEKTMILVTDPLFRQNMKYAIVLLAEATHLRFKFSFGEATLREQYDNITKEDAAIYAAQVNVPEMAE